VKKVGLEPGVKESELWMVRVVSRESKKRHGEAYLKERSVMRNEDDVGGRARVT